LKLRSHRRHVYVSLKAEFRFWVTLLAGACCGYAFSSLTFVTMLLVVSLLAIALLCAAEITGTNQT
jgi:hypothetical protein